MVFRKISLSALVTTAIFGLSACGATVGAHEDVATAGTEPSDVTCERFNDVNGAFYDMDLQDLDADELLMHFNEGIEELESVSSDAGDTELAQAITTMVDALQTAVESADGGLDAVHAGFEEQLQGVNVQDAAAHIDETCDARMNL